MSERKKTNLIKLAIVLGVIIVVAGVVISGVFDNRHPHFRVINNADDEIYSITLRCYNAAGEQSGTYETGPTRNGKVINFQNVREPFSYGEKIDLDTEFRRGTIVSDTLNLTCKVQIVAQKGQEADQTEKVASPSVDVPYEKGKRPVLILTGNKEDGYELTYTGKSVNWLIG